MSITGNSIGDNGGTEFTKEQIEGIWKRVLAGIDDLAGAYEALMMDNYSQDDDMPGDNTPELPELRADEGEYPAEYSVYSDIEKSVYGRPAEPQISFRAPEMQENDGFDPFGGEPAKKPGRSLLEDPAQEGRQAQGNEEKAFQDGKENGGELDGLVSKLIDNQIEQSRFCRSLARSAPNRRTSRVMSLISNRNYSSARSLASAYFMNSGSYHFPGSGHPASGVPYSRPALRNVWKSEVSLTTGCAGAAEKTEDVPLLKALIAAARSHAENAIDLRRMITQYAETQHPETQYPEEQIRD